MAATEDHQDHGPVLSVTQARQASRGRHMAWVLGVSMVLIVAGFSALWLGSAARLSGSDGQTRVDNPAAVQGFQTPGAAAAAVGGPAASGPAK